MKNYLLCPFNKHDLNNEIFNSPYGILKDLLKEKDININTYDLGELEKADKILFFNHNYEVLKRCSELGIPAEKLILFLYEPRVVIPKQYDHKVLSKYGKVFSWDDSLIDNRKIFKMRCPQGCGPLDIIPSFDERKNLVLINANKCSFEENELYSYRRKFIDYFEEECKDFDLYGYGWNCSWKYAIVNTIKMVGRNFALAKCIRAPKEIMDIKKYRHCYKGSIANKYDTLQKYKYCICFENDTTVGYVTEKIFDCLICGTIPIYLGATNIEQYIPKSIFIDMRNFKNFQQLYEFINSIDQNRFMELQTAGQNFIKSQNFEVWKPKHVFEEIVLNL